MGKGKRIKRAGRARASTQSAAVDAVGELLDEVAVPPSSMEGLSPEVQQEITELDVGCAMWCVGTADPELTWHERAEVADWLTLWMLHTEDATTVRTAVFTIFPAEDREHYADVVNLMIEVSESNVQRGKITKPAHYERWRAGQHS